MLMPSRGFGDNHVCEQPGNWVAISRDIEHHPIVGFGQPMKPANPKRGAYSKNEAWQFLVFRAEFKRKRVTNKGNRIWLDRGELMGGIAWFAECWNWTQDAVRWFLKQLERDMMVVRHNTNSDTRLHAHSTGILSICNYNKYQLEQDLEDLLGTEGNTNSEDPASQHQLNTNSNSRSTPTQHQLTNEGEQGFWENGNPDYANSAPTRTHRSRQHYKQETREQDSSPDGELSLSSDLPPSEDPVAKTVREAHRLYNETAKQLGLPTARVLNKARERSLALRIKEAGGLDGFREALANLGKSSFLQGQNDRGWRADLEFVCQAKSFAKLMDGAYTDRDQTSNSTRRVLDELKAKKQQETNHG